MIVKYRRCRNYTVVTCKYIIEFGTLITPLSIAFRLFTLSFHEVKSIYTPSTAVVDYVVVTETVLCSHGV